MAAMASPPELDLRAELSALPAVRSWAETVAKTAGLCDTLETFLLAAVDEAAANVIEHGYQGLPAGHLRLAALVEEGRILVRIEDEGSAFDSSRGGGPLDLDWRARWNLGRGLGRHLIRRCVHQVLYERLPQGTNRLTLFFKTDSEASEGRGPNATMGKNGEPR